MVTVVSRVTVIIMETITNMVTFFSSPTVVSMETVINMVTVVCWQLAVQRQLSEQ